MSPRTSHPIAEAYLTDLHRLLGGLPPEEREEVLAGVREHLDAVLSESKGDDDAVRRALAELGPPQAVADEAYAGLPLAAVPTSRPPALTREWVPVTVAVLLGIAVLVIIAVVGGVGGYTTSSSTTTADATGTQSVVETIDYAQAFPAATLAGLVATILLWGPASILVALSPLWTGRRQLLLHLLVPLSAVLLTALPDLGWVLTHREIGINLGAWASLATVVLGGGWLLARLTRRRGHPQG